MKYFIFSLAAVLLFAASCTKINAPVTQQDWLRSGKWRVTNATIHNKSVAYKVDTTYTDASLYDVKSCNADNTLVFGAVNGGTVNTGSNKCNVSEPDNQTFFWELLNDGKHLNIYNADLFFGITSVSAAVTNFSKNGFTLQYSYWAPVPDPSDPSFRTINDTVTVTANFTNN
jgi:hypothetical protein